MVSVENSCFLIGVLLAVLRLSCGDKVSAVTCTDQGTECKSYTNSTCETTSHKCKCSTGYEENLADGSTCVKVVSAKNCTGTGQCTGITNSVCSSDKCKCVDGFTQKVDTCVKILDSACTTANANTVCTVAKSECKSTHCKCKEGYAESNAACVKAKISAVPCTDGGTECNGITNSACETTSNKCKCSTDYKEDLTDGSTCVKILDSACTTANANTVCTVAKSECKSTHCKCKEGYAESNAACVKVVSATDCTGTGPCTGITNSVCSSKKCKCADGFAEKVNTCVKSEGGNSARSVVQSAGLIFMSLVVTVFQKLL